MERITFTVGEPALLALKFDTAKAVEGRYGPQFLFTTTDGRNFYLDVDPARDVQDAIREQGIRTGEEFKLTKCKTSHGGHRMVVERAVTPRRDAGGHNVPARTAAHSEPPAPAWDDIQRGTPLAATAPTPPTSGAGSSVSTLMSSYMQAIDALCEAQAYAARKGMVIAFTGEDVRSTAISCFIGAQKGGRY